MAVLWYEKPGIYLGHWRQGLSTCILLDVSIPHDAEILWVCTYYTVWHLTEMLTLDCWEYGRLLDIWWQAEIIQIGVTTMGNQLKSFWEERGRTKLSGLTGSKGRGPLCVFLSLPLRLSVSFPWTAPLLAISNQYLPKALHSKECSAENWLS